MDAKDISQLVLDGFTDWQSLGNVTVTENGDLLQFSYNYDRDQTWNDFECICRGLIINKTTGEIVAWPFDKFFGWLEGGRKATGYIVTVTEKLDGSLGILYRDNGGYKIATQRSLYGRQAIWATRFLEENFDLDDLNPEYTLLFEIIYPDNQIIIDYKGKKDIVLLGVRNRFTGEYLPYFPDLIDLADYFEFNLPEMYSFNNIREILEATGKADESIEGWVVEFSDGSRWKFKGDRYLELQQIMAYNQIKWRIK